MSGADRPKVAWVTGAGKGIGRALALRLARQGYAVAASARSEQDLISLEQVADGGRITGFPLDITDAGRADVMVEVIENRLGPLDLVVLNAGTHRPTPAAGFSAAEARSVIDTNLSGTLNCLAPVMARFQNRGAGQIAVVASLAGYRGLPGAAAYGASKAGLINLCEALRPELAAAGVDLRLINPGFVRTPLTDKNDFPMPFLIDVEEAVDRIVDGLGGNGFEIAFPRRFAFLMKLLRLLPDPLFFAVTRRMLRP
jgi:NAD(P)-dependent dehydrogenase (short-subunit alcohol dehydrogenase family)